MPRARSGSLILTSTPIIRIAKNTRAAIGPPASNAAKAKHVIFLFMNGGLSQVGTGHTCQAQGGDVPGDDATGGHGDDDEHRCGEQQGQRRREQREQQAPPRRRLVEQPPLLRQGPGREHLESRVPQHPLGADDRRDAVCTGENRGVRGR